MVIGPRRMPADPARGRTDPKVGAETTTLTPETTVMITQLDCSEPGCPPVETAIALLRAGETPIVRKVHKPIAELDRLDVATAFADHAPGEGGQPMASRSDGQ